MYTVTYDPPTKWYTVQSKRLREPIGRLTAYEAGRMVALLRFPYLIDYQLADMGAEIERQLESDLSIKKYITCFYDDELDCLWLDSMRLRKP